MSRRCECCRRCTLAVPTRSEQRGELMPPVEVLRLIPFATLVDAAGAYDEEGEEMTSAVEFVWSGPPSA